MGKKFSEYAAERAKRASVEEATAVEVFDKAYAVYSVGAAIAAARKAQQLNQTQLAALADIDQGDVSRIERGLITPTAPTLMKLVHALDGELVLNVANKTATEGQPSTLSLVVS